MTGALRNARLVLVLRLLGIGALMLALAITSTGTVAAFDRDPGKDFNSRTIGDAGNTNPQGIWSDGDTMWVADWDDDKIYAYDLEEKARVPAKDFNGLKAAGNEDPVGIWSDRTTIWVADYEDDKLYAYLTGSRAWDSNRDFDTLRAAGNEDPVGIWSDGSTMWVADDGDDKIYAYDLASKARIPARDFDGLKAAGNEDPSGIWSDGTTMWVSDWGNDKIYAYDLASKARIPARDFETLQAAGNHQPTGIWSDGDTIWVADNEAVEKCCWYWVVDIRAYNMPEDTAYVEPADPVADPAAFDRDPGKDFNSRTIGNAGNINPQGIWSDGDTMWVADWDDDKIYAYDLEEKARVPAKDFNGLKAAGNEDPVGIWSDRTTMWVADYEDDKLYAYLTGSRAWDSNRDFDTLRAAGNRAPVGIWSDGSTMWVADDGDDKIYAYDLASKARIPARDFDGLKAAGNEDPSGIWSDGTTMWVADDGDDKIYAYDLASKARIPARDFETLQAAGNHQPTGIWSDGDTIWVADNEAVEKCCWYWVVDIRAYNMPEDTAYVEPADPVADPAAFDRDPGKDFNSRTIGNAGNTNPQGIWSDGDTMWVADWDDDKIYAYDLEEKARVPAKDFNGLKAAGNEDPVGIWSDRTTMWVADYEDDKLYAYLTGSRAWDSNRDFDTLRAAGNRAPVGIWSDGSTMWVADDGDDKIYAYDLASKARIPARDFDGLKAAGNEDPSGIWSDGTTMWVADDGDDKIYAYDLASKARIPARDFETLQAAGNHQPTGIWSDGDTIWVADNEAVEKCCWYWVVDIRAYNMPEDTAYVEPADPVADPAAFDRDPGKDFNSRTIGNAGNTNPQGIWSDGDTMWVADWDDDKIYAYDLEEKARVPAKDFNGLKAAGNEDPVGIWSDETTMWVADWDGDKIYAYDLASKARIPARDFNTLTLRAAGNRAPVGIWSDGITMWVADDGDDKIYAYDLASKARIPARDFDGLKAAGNEDPSGIWSDGTTMWVSDWGNDKIYAYDLASKARIPARDFETLQAAGNHQPTGIWSDGDTIWVADNEAVEKCCWYWVVDIRAYNMPPGPPATRPGAPAITTPITAGAGSLTVSWRAPSGDASGITAYDLRYTRTGADDWTVVQDVWTGTGPLRYEIRELTGGTQYRVQVRAVNSFGDGPWSATATATPTVPMGASATRSFSPATVEPGGTLTVTIAATNYGFGGSVTETLPAGFSYVSSTHGSVTHPFDGNSQMVSFTLFGEASFTYTVTASDVDGPHAFSGTLTDSDKNIHTVGGDTTVTVGDAPPGVAVSRAGTDPAPPVRIGTAIPVAATFTKTVTGFTVDDVTVSNGTVGNFLGSATAYTFDVTPNAIGQVAVDIAANVAQDAGGNGNTAAAQLQLGIPYDDNRNGVIERGEVIKAINDYLGAGSVERSHVIALINLYLSGQSAT